jgi:hypothetical protein
MDGPNGDTLHCTDTVCTGQSVANTYFPDEYEYEYYSSDFFL